MTPADRRAAARPRDGDQQARSLTFQAESLHAATQRRAATIHDATWIQEDRPQSGPDLAEALAAQYQPRPTRRRGRANTTPGAPQWSHGGDPEDIPAPGTSDRASGQPTSHGQHGPEQTVTVVLTRQATRLRDGLPPGCFPADREQLLEAAVHHHAPPATIQILFELPTGRIFTDLPTLLDTIDARSDETRTQ